jgi:hypothetical protein
MKDKTFLIYLTFNIYIKIINIKHNSINQCFFLFLTYDIKQLIFQIKIKFEILKN